MKSALKGLPLLMLTTFLAGCLTVSQYTLSIDYRTGACEIIYHDIRSMRGGDEKDYSLEKDWNELQRLVQDKEPKLDPDVVEEVSKELFQELDVLSARMKQRVRCPKCFPSKAALLSYVQPEEWRSELINDEIFLFLPTGTKIVSTNGISLATKKNAVIIWPGDTDRFEYVVREQALGGETLLPFFLKDKDK